MAQDNARDARAVEGRQHGRGLRVAVVASRWNDTIVSRLIEGAISTFVAHGVEEKHVRVLRVPGSYELPFAVQECIDQLKVDGVAALGCLLKGETDHYDLISQSVVPALQDIMLRTQVPVGLGVICADTMDQAVARCGGAVGNYGSEAAAAVVEMAELQKLLARERAA